MLTTKLVLERLSQEGRLLERRCQPARSFTRGLIELLYVSHAEIVAASPYSMADIDLVPRDVDVQSVGAGTGRYAKTHLRIGAPGGVSSVKCHPGIASVNYDYRVKILGCDLGIEVGVGTTAVTPTDRRLEQRIGHGRRLPDGAAVVFESATTGDMGEVSLYAGTHFYAVPFMPEVSHRMTSVRVKIFKDAGDTPGDVTVLIQGVDDEDPPNPPFPSGVTLATGTILEAAIPVDTPGDWVECTFGTPVDVYAGHQYYIILQALTGDAANPVKWRYTDTPTNERCSVYVPSFWASTTDGGVNWTDLANYNLMFEDKGQSVGEFEYGGCALDNMVFADPNGEFTIRRYFTNHCGQAVTVNEAGMTATGTRYTTGYAWPFLIAHDIVAPGVAVANGELLRATYVPQITV